jgi:hypothetical protein
VRIVSATTLKEVAIGGLSKELLMKRSLFLLGLLALLLLSAIAAAAAGGYSLPWWTVDGGGGTSGAAGGYTLSGTVGQPDARALTNSSYRLEGGFWGVITRGNMYLPLILR